MDNFPIQAPAFEGRSRQVNAGAVFAWLRMGWNVFMVNPGVWVVSAVIVLVGFAALMAFSGTSEVVRQKATGKAQGKWLTFYRTGAPIALSLGVGAFLYLFLKGLPA